MKLILDYWVEGKDTGSTIEEPSLETIADAITALDGLNRTMICLTYSEKCYLLVAGPCNNGYLVNGTLNNREFFSPKNTEAEPIQVSCYIGGQDGIYRAEQFVPKNIAECAAAYFCKYQDLSPDIDWYSRNGIGPRLERIG